MPEMPPIFINVLVVCCSARVFVIGTNCTTHNLRFEVYTHISGLIKILNVNFFLLTKK